MRNARGERHVSAAENVVAFPTEPDSGQPLLPEGEYRLTFDRYRIARRFNRDVLELWFRVADFGEYHGAKLARYYAVRASEKRRNFTTRPGSDFVREYARVFARRPRFGTGALEAFERHLIVGRIGTVKTDHRQETLPPSLHYSSIRQLLRREGG